MKKVEKDILYEKEVYAIIGATIEVHKELGPGFLEPVYQEAMEIELSNRGIPSEFLKRLLIQYKGRQLRKEYEADAVCYGKIIVEFKSLDRLTRKEEAQLLNYLKATGFRVGLLINFGSVGTLEWKRFIK
ncbi:MAG: GxxExxY protein [Bacteroidota bacterium]